MHVQFELLNWKKSDIICTFVIEIRKLWEESWQLITDKSALDLL